MDTNNQSHPTLTRFAARLPKGIRHYKTSAMVRFAKKHGYNYRSNAVRAELQAALTGKTPPRGEWNEYRWLAHFAWLKTQRELRKSGLCVTKLTPEPVNPLADLLRLSRPRPFSSPIFTSGFGKWIRNCTEQCATSYGHGHYYTQGYVESDSHILTLKNGSQRVWFAGTPAKTWDNHPLARFKGRAKHVGQLYCYLETEALHVWPVIKPLVAPRGYKWVKDRNGYALMDSAGLEYHPTTEECELGIKNVVKKLKDKRNHFKKAEAERKQAEREWRKRDQAAKKREKRLERLITRADKDGLLVTLDDSIRSGNCKAGTLSFCDRLNLDPVHGCSPSKLLAIAGANIHEVKLAIYSALKRFNGHTAEVMS